MPGLAASQEHDGADDLSDAQQRDYGDEQDANATDYRSQIAIDAV